MGEGGWYYLHENGELIFKRFQPEQGGEGVSEQHLGLGGQEKLKETDPEPTREEREREIAEVLRAVPCPVCKDELLKGKVVTHSRDYANHEQARQMARARAIMEQVVGPLTHLQHVCTKCGYVTVDQNVHDLLAARDARIARLEEALTIAEPYVASYPRGTKGIDEAAVMALQRVRAALADAGAGKKSALRCGCRKHDAWRCAQEQQLTGQVSCWCQCHRADAGAGKEREDGL